jgi:5,10-methylenetetrahydrofolate reductase
MATMGFVERLNRRPVLVEVIPPARGAPPARIEQSLALVGSILDRCGADAVNVPEIIGSGFQSMDPLDFGLLVHERYGAQVVVNKVVVHTPPDAFQTWITRVLDSPIASAILVGGERGGIYYPGPRVTEANRLTRELAASAGRTDFAVGNVTLPTRPHEAARMVEKAASGCDFFTSQIVYEFPSANAHLQAYDDLCALEAVPPRPVLYAFSPAESESDIRFLRYLGVHVPPEVERAILAPGSAGASLRIIEAVWRELLAAARARGVRVPLGVVVETVSRHHGDAVGPLVQRLRGELEAADLALQKTARPA